MSMLHYFTFSLDEWRLYFISAPARSDSTIKPPVGEHIRLGEFNCQKHNWLDYNAPLDLGAEREIYDEDPYGPEAIADSFRQLKECVPSMLLRWQYE
jgi:hypothetical protein